MVERQLDPYRSGGPFCSCMKCTRERMAAMVDKGKTSLQDMFPGPHIKGWRYSCHQCGNKRCPHHTDHKLKCTKSNDSGQPGSWFT